MLFRSLFYKAIEKIQSEGLGALAFDTGCVTLAKLLPLSGPQSPPRKYNDWPRGFSALKFLEFFKKLSYILKIRVSLLNPFCKEEA